MDKYLKTCSEHILESMQFINEVEAFPADSKLEDLENRKTELSDLISKKRIEGTKKFTRPTGMTVDFRDVKGYNQYKKELEALKKELDEVNTKIKNIKGDVEYKPEVGIDVKTELQKLKDIKQPDVEQEETKAEDVVETPKEEPKKEEGNVYEINLADGVYPAKWDGFELSIKKDKKEISVQFDREAKNPKHFNIRVLKNKFIFDPENNLNLGEREYTPKEKSMMFGLEVPQTYKDWEKEKEPKAATEEAPAAEGEKKKRSRIEKFGKQVWSEKNIENLKKAKEKIEQEVGKKKRDKLSSEIQDMFDEEQADEATGTDIGGMKSQGAE